MNDIKEILEYLGGFITQRRNRLIDRVLDNRTRYITLALEDIYQSHNASAVLRTCECFGIQDVHIVENRNRYILNPDVVMGAVKWLDLYKYNELEFNTLLCVKGLREKGYRIVATLPNPGSTALEDFELERGKAAIFFGNELTGLTRELLETADEFIFIPISGFTGSFNISVSAAIILHQLVHKLKQSVLNWKLSEQEKDELKLRWFKKDIRNADHLIERFLSDRGQQPT